MYTAAILTQAACQLASKKLWPCKTELMLGGGQYSHALTMNWIEATFLAELLRDSKEAMTPRALKLGISNC